MCPVHPTEVIQSGAFIVRAQGWMEEDLLLWFLCGNAINEKKNLGKIKQGLQL